MYGTEQFDKAKEKVIYERVTNTLNMDTGELVEQVGESVKTVQKEPDFVKVYLNTVLAFKGIKGISTDFLFCLCNYITYANDKRQQMMVVLTKMVKENMAKSLNIGTNMVEKYIRKCISGGVLFKTEYRGTYIVNPFLLARGEWQNIKSLRTEFDFVNGTWKYVKRFKTDEELEEQEQKRKEESEKVTKFIEENEQQEQLEGQTTIDGVA